MSRNGSKGRPPWRSRPAEKLPRVAFRGGAPPEEKRRPRQEAAHLENNVTAATNSRTGVETQPHANRLAAAKDGGRR
jgi:hypothetical protein